MYIYTGPCEGGGRGFAHPLNLTVLEGFVTPAQGSTVSLNRIYLCSVSRFGMNTK